MGFPGSASDKEPTNTEDIRDTGSIPWSDTGSSPGGGHGNPLQYSCLERVRFLGQEDPLEGGVATLFSIRAWRIPWTEEPVRLQSMGSWRVGHDWSDSMHEPKVAGLGQRFSKLLFGHGVPFWKSSVTESHSHPTVGQCLPRGRVTSFQLSSSRDRFKRVHASDQWVRENQFPLRKGGYTQPSPSRNAVMCLKYLFIHLASLGLSCGTGDLCCVIWDLLLQCMDPQVVAHGLLVVTCGS